MSFFKPDYVEQQRRFVLNNILLYLLQFQIARSETKQNTLKIYRRNHFSHSYTRKTLNSSHPSFFGHSYISSSLGQIVHHSLSHLVDLSNQVSSQKLLQFVVPFRPTIAPWNSLPVDLRQISQSYSSTSPSPLSPSVFHKSFKANMFYRSFPPWTPFAAWIGIFGTYTGFYALIFFHFYFI